MRSDSGRDPIRPSPAGLAVGKGWLQTIGDAVPGILWLANPKGVCTYVSRRWLEYAGAEAYRAGGQGGLSLVHPEDAPGGQDQWNKSLESGQDFDRELRLRRHDGVYRWHRVRAAAHRDGRGRLAGWVGICLDIEEQKQAEAESAVAQARLDRANEALERTVSERTGELQEVVDQLESFAYTIAHDMRAPLRAMHQYAEILSGFIGRVPREAAGYLGKIMAASEKLDTLVREVLVYTRISQGRLVMRPLNLEPLVREVLALLPQLNPPHAELHVRLPLDPVLGDGTAMTQVLFNLLGNAVKFVPKGRKPKIRVWTEPAGEKVRLSVRDNGLGIAVRDQGRIFKMFQRLQPESQYEGSGIGLTIVRRAVERMGGKLGVESAAGRGSTFWVELAKGDCH